jgi:pSer/pThr/pTyr-binding forkhead associated (FHA) protein
LSNKCFSIGRDKTNQIVVADPKASRFHAVITFENNCVYIKDTESSNGTFVNDVKIASNRKVKLKNGDRIKVGTTVLTLKQ